jgi:hypothetical protein
MFYCSSLSALTSDNSNYVKEQSINSNSIADSLIVMFNSNMITDNEMIYLDIQFPDNQNITKFEIQKMLLAKDYELVESKQFADYVVLIQSSELLMNNPSNSIFKQSELIKKEVYQIQLLRLVDMKVLTIKTIEVMNLYSNNDMTKDKWYTPFLITFVIGSLIYLLYYNNN